MLLWVLCVDPRKHLSISDYLDAGAANANHLKSVALRDVHDETSKLCAHVRGCIEGYRSDSAEFYRFKTKQDASRFAWTAPGAYRSDWVVLVFTDPDLSQADKAEVMTMFDTLAIRE